MSPIVWLCIEEDIELLLPMVIKIPHAITDINKVKLSFAKANHQFKSVGGKDVYSLEHLKDGESRFTNPSGRTCGYGILRVQHCCLYCINAATTANTARSTGYCLHTLIKTLSPSSLEVLHVCTYCLEGCFQVRNLTTNLVLAIVYYRQ